MEASISYWTYQGGGGHTLLSVIPYFLKLHEHQFGADIVELDVDVKFRSDTRPKKESDQRLFDHFEHFLPEEPSFRIVKTTKKLKIEYVSKHLPYDDGRSFGRYILEERATRGCHRLEKLVRELKDVMSDLGPYISKQCDFDWCAFVALVDERLKQLPKNDGEIISMIDEEYRTRADRPKETVEAEPYHSNIPEVIPVKRYDIGHSGTQYIGKYGKGNQFWGQVVATFRKPDVMPNDVTPSADEWQSRKCWYAILHKFDSRGKHLGTEYKFTGTTADGESAVCDQAEVHMNNFISALGPVKFGNIAIRLFKIEIDGHVFGMIDTSSEEWGDTATMEPGDLVFYPPWDGEYDT